MTVAADPAVRTVLHSAALRAALAPSVHNTQPWKFVVTTDALEIYADPDRQLAVLDPRGRQLTISCGCALFNARVAIATAGFEPVVVRFPDPDSPHLLARISVGEPCEWTPIADLDGAIDDRRTNRYAFADESVPHSVVHDLVSAARDEDTDLIPIVEPGHRRATAELSQLASRVQADDPAYLAELLAWTTDDPRRVDGVQARSIPYAGPLSDAHDALPIRPFDVRGTGWLPAASESDADHCLLLLASTGDARETWLRAGEALEHVWLALTRLGYAASPLTEIVEVAQTHERLRTALGVDLHPQLLLRVGLAPYAVPTNRRRADDVITDDEHSSPPQPGRPPAPDGWPR
jgi:nitroreductase family protein